MGLPDNNHVMRHVPYRKLLKDDEGNVLGLLPQAFELRERDKGKLSVNWIEYFENETQQENITSTVFALRTTRDISANSVCAFGIGNVKKIKDVCNSFTSKKVDVVHTGWKGNESHSSIIRMPENDLDLMTSLAEDVFVNIIPNEDVPSE